MKTLIVYDSVHGNTEKIAKAIGDAITGDVKVYHAGEVNSSEFKTVDLLIVGSPTHGGKPTREIQDLLNKVPVSDFKGASMAAFDTRLSMKLVRIFGYAAEKIASNLKNKGWTIIVPPEGFFVKGKKGPLEKGELERATGWAKEIIKRKSGPTTK
jgi:flavodoxin I